jgi:hypothetical protein
VDARGDPRKHAEGARIAPLDVVDRQHHGCPGAQLVEQLEHGLGDSELALAGHVGPDVPSVQMLVQTPAPRRRGRSDTVDDRGERSMRLELLRLRGEDRSAGRARGFENRFHEPRLADPSLALDDGEAPAPPHRPDDRLEGGQLRLATHERRLA